MRKMVAMITVLLMICLAGTSLAKDVWGGPPEDTWARGDQGTTFEHWDFSNPELFEPENFDNPNGIPFAEFDPTDGWYWGPEWECPPEMDPSGFVDGWHCENPDGGTITLVIPNTDDPAGKKWIFMQVTSTKGYSVTVSGSGSNTGGYTSGTWPTGKPQLQWPGPAPYGGCWYTYNSGLWIEPNPESETITLTFPYCSVVDQIVIDTICTQDPIATQKSSWSRVKALFR
jgi:hypothetical protein